MLLLRCPLSSLLSLVFHEFIQLKYGLEINAENAKYMIMSRHPNSGQNQNIRIANESFENVAKFIYLEKTLTNQNDVHDEIKSRLNSGNSYYHSVQNLLCSRLTSKNLKIKIYKTAILPVVLYGCENWSLILRRNIDSGFLRTEC
jgi:hypothetical protein